jgi:peptidoglycan/xylan/chitin deacetylase (PgdA/CDA1 family)
MTYIKIDGRLTDLIRIFKTIAASCERNCSTKCSRTLLAILFVLIAGSLLESLSGYAKASNVMYKNSAIILNYHNIQDGDQGAATLSPAAFKTHLDYLRSNGYNVVSLSRLCEFLAGKATLPPNAVCITFDDGYITYKTEAVPILRKYQYPSMCFIIVSDVDTTDFGTRLPHMNWKELIQLHKGGLVEYGSHTYALHGLRKGSTDSNPLTALTDPALNGDVVRKDLLKARNLLEGRVNIKVNQLAYPYGESTSKVMKEAKAAGYSFMFTTDSGLVTLKTDRLQIPRINAGSPWVDVKFLDNKIKEVIKGR